MFRIRNYEPTDLFDCTQCLYEGFFSCAINHNDRQFLQDYTKVMIERSNFTLVAEAEDKVVGLICGIYQKKFDAELAKHYEQMQDRSA